MNVVNDAAARRIIDIVANLRKFARLDESDWKKADLREGLDETLSLVEHQTRDRSASFARTARCRSSAVIPGS